MKDTKQRPEIGNLRDIESQRIQVKRIEEREINISLKSEA